nr:MAG TPA: hypothetical protein [Caudoviricetes sp.]
MVSASARRARSCASVSRPAAPPCARCRRVTKQLVHSSRHRGGHSGASSASSAASCGPHTCDKSGRASSSSLASCIRGVSCMVNGFLFSGRRRAGQPALEALNQDVQLRIRAGLQMGAARLALHPRLQGGRVRALHLAAQPELAPQRPHLALQRALSAQAQHLAAAARQACQARQMLQPLAYACALALAHDLAAAFAREGQQQAAVVVIAHAQAGLDHMDGRGVVGCVGFGSPARAFRSVPFGLNGARWYLGHLLNLSGVSEGFSGQVNEVCHHQGAGAKAAQRAAQRPKARRARLLQAGMAAALAARLRRCGAVAHAHLRTMNWPEAAHACPPSRFRVACLTIWVTIFSMSLSTVLISGASLSRVTVTPRRLRVLASSCSSAAATGRGRYSMRVSACCGSMAPLSVSFMMRSHRARSSSQLMRPFCFCRPNLRPSTTMVRGLTKHSGWAVMAACKSLCRAAILRAALRISGVAPRSMVLTCSRTACTSAASRSRQAA